jgi:hypothetical protein
MELPEIQGPDLAGVVASARAAGLKHVVIGGFAVGFNGAPRATNDSDLLVPDGPETDAAIGRFLAVTDARRLSDGRVLGLDEIAGAQHLRLDTRHGVVDLMRGGLPPLDFDSVAQHAITIQWRDQPVSFANLASIVAFKRLAGRLQDRVDLERLQDVHGDLPIEPIPGLDDAPPSAPSGAS